MPVVSRLDSVEISDSQAVWDAYVQGFKNCQQTLCKLIAKAWVKAVEPKKQTAHPYTKNDEGAPDWWPKPWGPTKDEKVRHKEPDHLYKRGMLPSAAELESLFRAADVRDQSEFICCATFSDSSWSHHRCSTPTFASRRSASQSWARSHSRRCRLSSPRAKPTRKNSNISPTYSK